MTAAAVETADTTANGNSKPQHQLPLHNAPSIHDILALKRQRCSLDEDAVESCPLNENSASGRVNGNQPTGNLLKGAVVSESFLQSSTFTAPVLTAVPGELMSVYFQRLRETQTLEPHIGVSAATLELDGIYVHKRPIRAPDGSSPLAFCGSVLHHVLVLVKQGPLLHTLDFGPSNGADVTANIMEAAPCKKVLTTTTTITAPSQFPATVPPSDAPDRVAATAGSTEELPYLYLGPAKYDVNHRVVRQLIDFAESRPYHALQNNCIHFADALVRVLTAGSVRSAPMLYDITCGSVPPVDNPILMMMMQLMLRMPWFGVVDGSPLTAAFLEHYCQSASPLGEEDTVTAALMDAAERDNNLAAEITAGSGVTPCGVASVMASEAEAELSGLEDVPEASDSAGGVESVLVRDAAKAQVAGGVGVEGLVSEVREHAEGGHGQLEAMDKSQQQQDQGLRNCYEKCTEAALRQYEDEERRREGENERQTVSDLVDPVKA